jgi:hypothetical protein
MPSKIPIAREVVYLRTLAETGNATLAAERAGTSRTWAYKRRAVDARFDRRCREMAALAKTRLPARVNRDRKGGWTAAKEARFIERLRETCSVWMAAAAVGLSTVSAYRRRQRRRLGGAFHPGQPSERFAAAWDEAERIGWPPADKPWIESALCFFEGREPPPGNPVRIRTIDDVLEAMKGNRFAPKRPRAKRS